MPLSPPSSGLSGGVGGLDGDRASVLLAGLGILTQNGPEYLGGSNFTPVAGTIYCLAVGCRNGDVLTNLLARVATAGAGTVPTLIRQGVADSTGKVLAITAASQAAAAWTATGLASVPLSAPLTIPSSGLYYVCFITTGAWGTTQMQLGNTSQNATTGAVAGFPRPVATQSGQTDLPAVNSSITLGGSGAAGIWAGAN